MIPPNRLPAPSITALAALFLAGQASIPASLASENDQTTAPLLAAFEASEEKSDAAISRLRERGPEGLQLLLNAAAEWKGHPRYAEIVDRVAGQKDASRSGLYWHTDFEKAKAAAKSAQRPILSLRLLGRLDEEYSCANSRLFRELLYPDPRVGKHLRENYVLHWKSVRPVPVVTIDFGDGRILKRTLTGNSAHYITDHQGRVADCLPGLYNAGSFLEHLTRAGEFVKAKANHCSRTWPGEVADYHRKSFVALQADFNRRLKAAGLTALGKRLGNEFEMNALSDDEWSKIAAQEQRPRLLALEAVQADALSRGKGRIETKLVKKVAKAELALRKRANLDEAAAIDTVRNEQVLHRRIHLRFIKAAHRTEWDVDKMNAWVYSELFKTPDSDPWLGLHDPDVFTGLEDDGVVKDQPAGK